MVGGVRAGAYTRSVLNRKYAIDAVMMLRQNPSFGDNENALWRAVQGNDGKAHNAQMDVVITLWKEGLISF